MAAQPPRLTVVFAERAKKDITEIYDAIAQHNPIAAQRVEDAIRRTCEGLGEYPFASAATDEPNVRRIPIARYPYTVFFRVDAVGRKVEIARVVHSKRVRSLGQIPR